MQLRQAQEVCIGGNNREFTLPCELPNLCIRCFTCEPNPPNVRRFREQIRQQGHDPPRQIRVEKQLHCVTLSLS